MGLLYLRALVCILLLGVIASVITTSEYGLTSELPVWVFQFFITGASQQQNF